MFRGKGKVESDSDFLATLNSSKNERNQLSSIIFPLFSNAPTFRTQSGNVQVEIYGLVQW